MRSSQADEKTKSHIALGLLSYGNIYFCLVCLFSMHLQTIDSCRGFGLVRFNVIFPYRKFLFHKTNPGLTSVLKFEFALD